MTTELNIPQAAYETAGDALFETWRGKRAAATFVDLGGAAVDAAAPLIVAAELDRLAAEWHTVAETFEQDYPDKALAYQEFSDDLAFRARELRGEV